MILTTQKIIDAYSVSDKTLKQAKTNMIQEFINQYNIDKFNVSFENKLLDKTDSTIVIATFSTEELIEVSAPLQTFNASLEQIRKDILQEVYDAVVDKYNLNHEPRDTGFGDIEYGCYMVGGDGLKEFLYNLKEGECYV